MTTLFIDLETYCNLELDETGVYPYVAHPSFEILLFGFTFDKDPVTCCDLLSGAKIPSEVLEAICSNSIIKIAHNANFEINCLRRHLKSVSSLQSWRCTMIHGYSLGLPGKLKEAGQVLTLEHQKDGAGKALINYFCSPCKPTKVNDGRTRNYPQHDPAKWQQFKDYNTVDVETEREYYEKLSKFPIPDFEHRLWVLDQKINDRGIKIDVELAKQAINCDDQYKSRLMIEAKELTSLNNPNSGPQLIAWLENRGFFTKSVDKDHVVELISVTHDPTVKRVLKLRQSLAKTSTSKYKAMINAKCTDDHFRGLLQFGGASRTMRWAGRKVQIHNLPKNKLPDLDLARQLVKSGDLETLELLFGKVPDTLSQLIRTAFIPFSENNRLLIVDFSAIEARITAWYAGEKWRLDTFNTHGKIYEASAAQTFKIPFETIVKGYPNYSYRTYGKVTELALGYQGAEDALIKMGALEMGIPGEELPEIVKKWRTANPNIVKFWYAVEAAAIKAVKEKTTTTLQTPYTKLIFSFESNMLFIKLPSGRRIPYPRAKIETLFIKPRVIVHPDGNREAKPGYWKDALAYEGRNEKFIWTKLHTYGGKLTENIVQATARDCLAEALVRLDAAGYDIAMHIHDEIVADMPFDVGSVDEANKIITAPIPWAPDLPLRANGFENNYYKKDD